jgi:hypothetical protein
MVLNGEKFSIYDIENKVESSLDYHKLFGCSHFQMDA